MKPVPLRAVLAVALGGACGAPARYIFGRAVHASHGFPIATVVINLSGAFLLGLLVIVVGERIAPTRYVRQFFGTGVLGAYTTYSTFAVETDLLLRHNRIAVAAAYMLATVLGGLACAALGAWTGRRIPLPGRPAV